MSQGTNIPKHTRTCPDCGGDLRQIRVVDKGRHGSFEDLEYTSIDAKPERWLGTAPVEGKIEAYICTLCSRVFFYGDAKYKLE